jgi:hypothetical protein
MEKYGLQSEGSNMTLGELVNKKAPANPKKYDFSSSESSENENHNDVQEEI